MQKSFFKIKNTAILGIVLCVAFLSGCVSPAALQVETSPDNAMYYGYIKTNRGAPKRVQLAPAGYYWGAHIYEDGTFLWTNLSPDKTYCHYLVDYGPAWVLVQPGDERCFKPKPGEMKFYGSLEIRETKKGDPLGFFSTSQVSGFKLQSPTKLEVLKKLAQKPDLVGTGWDKRIQKEIKRLSQN